MGAGKGILRRIGPGLVTAAVVLGPGSIVASSRAGAQASYALVWLLAVACACMAVFTSMGARLGCALTVTPLQYVAARWGRWLAVLTGLSAFLVTAGFQFGNNIGVAVGLASVTGINEIAWPPIFTVLALAFFLGARDVYAWLERFIIALVAVMIAAFAANLFWTGADPAKFARGLVPGVLAGPKLVIAGAMFATTFSAVAAFYQAYLVREKGWRRQDIPNAIGDAWAGIAVLGLIALTIMVGAAQVLHGSGADFKDVGALAGQ
jgi:Mn2+/Fe2+ NRAMP family transporter